VFATCRWVSRRLIPDVAAGTEGLVTGAGQDYNADFRVVGGAVHRVRQLFVGTRPDCIARMRPIDGNGRYLILALINDVFVFHGFNFTFTVVVDKRQPPEIGAPTTEATSIGDRV
jgi:hypothetical protein